MARKKAIPNALGWWGERWLTYAGDLYVGPSSDGQWQSAKRAITEISIARGQVRAVVQVGHQGTFATAVLKVKPLSDRGWRQALDAIAAEPDTAYRLLSGNFGPDVEETLGGIELALFPDYTGTGRPVRCSCQERGGCRHINALVVHAAAAFDGNPFLWLEVLGQPRAVLLAGLRARLADRSAAIPAASEVALTQEVTQPDQQLVPERFWQTEFDPDQIVVRPGSATAPDALLRLLGPLPMPTELNEVVRELVIRIGEGATGLARGDQVPDYTPETVVGKRISPGLRLVAEVTEAVRLAGRLLTLDQLRSLCPTAAPLPDNLYRTSLSDASPHLPPDLVILGQGYVGPKSAVLEGASFCHVITFDEWYTGRLSLDADWVRALAIVGCPSPFRIMVGLQTHSIETLGAALSLEVGDELALTVIDPVQFVLTATLRRQSKRTITERSRSSQIAGLTLLRFLSETGRNSLSEQDGLGVLLGERRYREPISPDPVWLLPLFVQGLYHQGSLRGITSRYSYWGSTFGVAAYGYWNEQGVLPRFQAALKQLGLTRQRAEMATTCIVWWCRYCRSAQDTIDRLPPIGALLSFLWLVVPQEIARYRITPELVPGFLALWFTVLSEGNAALEQAYRQHIAACNLGEAFALRIRSQQAGGIGHQAWEVEGCRWIGPAHYFSPVEPAAWG